MSEVDNLIKQVREDYNRMLEVCVWPPTWERYLYLVERETQWHREQHARNQAEKASE